MIKIINNNNNIKIQTLIASQFQASNKREKKRKNIFIIFFIIM